MDTKIIISFISLFGTGLAVFFAYLASSRSKKIDERIANQEREDKLKFISFDKRLEIHQAAYGMVLELWLKQADEIIVPEWNKSRNWFYSHCLYLDEDSKKALYDYIFSINLLLMFQVGTQEYTKQFKKCEKSRDKTLECLTVGVGVPWIKLNLEEVKKPDIHAG